MNEDTEIPKFSAFDHLKRDVAAKSIRRSESRNTTGLSTGFKAFLLLVVIFGGLLLSGALTGPGPDFINSNNNDNNNNNLPAGQDNSEPLTNLCVQHGGFSAHYHFTLFIYINDISQIVPANIGIPNNNCMRPLHTHDGSGKVHIELSTGYSGGNPTLGDFFSIWGEPFSDTSVLGSTGSVEVIVNSQTLTENVRSIIPVDEDQITIRLVR